MSKNRDQNRILELEEIIDLIDKWTKKKFGVNVPQEILNHKRIPEDPAGYDNDAVVDGNDTTNNEVYGEENHSQNILRHSSFEDQDNLDSQNYDFDNLNGNDEEDIDIDIKPYLNVEIFQDQEENVDEKTLIENHVNEDKINLRKRKRISYTVKNDAFDESDLDSDSREKRVSSRSRSRASRRRATKQMWAQRTKGIPGVYILSCRFCKQEFIETRHFRYHLKKYHPHIEPPPKSNANVGQYPCPKCNKVFAYMRKLKAHSKMHIEDRPRNFICSICNGAYFDEYQLTNHHKQVHIKLYNLKDLLCTTCGKAFNRSFDLRKHEMTHLDLDERPTVKCHICGMVLLAEKTLALHLKAHAQEKDFICEVPNCGKKFITRAYLLKHGRNVHTCDSWTCEICGRSFTSEQRFKFHIETHTQTEITCEFNCGMTFMNKGTYESHRRRIHRSEREDFTFICPFEDCNERFGTQIWLDRHLEKHKIIYECKICNLTFKTRRFLWNHNRRHNRSKP